MTEEKKPRHQPAAFDLQQGPTATQQREPGQFSEAVELVPEAEDPFENMIEAEDIVSDTPAPPRRFPLFKIASAALGIVVSLAFGLWADQLVRDLFTRSDWLGYIALGALSVLIIAVLAVITRELAGLASLRNVEKLRERLAEASQSNSSDTVKSAVKELCDHLASTPQTASGRATMAEALTDIIDGGGLIRLAETELLKPLDQDARYLIANSARRVSVVTAVSPRAFVDIGYVLFEAARLVRSLSALYGGRPGFFGMVRLLRAVIAHLAVTGTIALGDSLVQQVLGHGLASKVSARLGEGVANGLMTARVGAAAMELARPMPFVAEKRPKVTDFLTAVRPAVKTA